jgi:hypothetical protein
MGMRKSDAYQVHISCLSQTNVILIAVLKFFYIFRSWIRPDDGSKTEPKIVACKTGSFNVVFVNAIEEL